MVVNTRSWRAVPEDICSARDPEIRLVAEGQFAEYAMCLVVTNRPTDR